jgi:hypothetical protein
MLLNVVLYNIFSFAIFPLPSGVSVSESDKPVITYQHLA